LREELPDLRIRVVNVVDLMSLQPSTVHPHGLDDSEFDEIFTTNRPIVFAFHGYPWLIHRLTYRRNGHSNLHVRGYVEEGTTTTPFDMTVVNGLDRFHLALDIVDRVPRIKESDAGGRFAKSLEAKLAEHHDYICVNGEDMPEVQQWRWKQPA
jgi:xylulose-5-phosphate/fructose-6-phosphate phosphoketolase